MNTKEESYPPAGAKTVSLRVPVEWDCEFRFRALLCVPESIRARAQIVDFLIHQGRFERESSFWALMQTYEKGLASQDARLLDKLISRLGRYAPTHVREPFEGETPMSRRESSGKDAFPHLKRLAIDLIGIAGTLGDGVFDWRNKLPSTEGIEGLLRRTVCGQNDAIRRLSPVLHRHWLALNKARSRGKALACLSAHRRLPVLITGPTGSGKTFLLDQIGKLLGLPVTFCDASSLVESGIVGKSLNDVFKAIYRRTEQGDKITPLFSIVVIDEVDKLITGKSVYANVQSELLRVLEGHLYDLQSHAREDFPSGRTLDLSNVLFVLLGSFQSEAEALVSEVLASERPIGFQCGSIPTSGAASVVPNGEDFLRRNGLMTEMLGRIGRVVTLRDLEVGDYLDLLRSGESPFDRQACLIENDYGVKATLTDAAIGELAQRAHRAGLGVRAIINWSHQLLDRIVSRASCGHCRPTVRVGIADVRETLGYQRSGCHIGSPGPP
jgi:ATP-dependent Clp protease ATP-binding subunit ClpX